MFEVTQTILSTPVCAPQGLARMLPAAIPPVRAAPHNPLLPSAALPQTLCVCFAKSGPIATFLPTPARTYLPTKEPAAARNFTYYIKYLRFSVKSKLLQMTTETTH